MRRHHVLAAGMPLDDNAFAMDAFQEVAPGSHFLGCQHTMRNYETAFYTYELSDNNSFEQWTEEGALDLPRAPTPNGSACLPRTRRRRSTPAATKSCGISWRGARRAWRTRGTDGEARA